MPIPKPKDGESQDAWIERCMGNDTMKEDFPDNDQRLAVCFQQWKDKDKEKDSDKQENIERRYYPFSEVRVDDQKEPKLVGYAAVFDSLSEEMWGFREKVAKGAFEKTIQNDDIRALWNHNPDYVLGRNKAGTLTLKEDNKGLYFEAIPPDAQWAKDLMVSIRRGDVTQNSFGFVILDDDWDEDDHGQRIRTLNKVKLYDISPVTYPAYPATELHIRGRWGETMLVYDKLKEGTKTTISNIVRANEKAKVKQNATIYGMNERIFSITEPNPTIVLTEKPVEKDGNTEAQKSYVEPKPKSEEDQKLRNRISKYVK